MSAVPVLADQVGGLLLPLRVGIGVGGDLHGLRGLRGTAVS
ncbi:hypothetical protein ABZU25_33850 [Micromonospora sp. NPDC005215]